MVYAISSAIEEAGRAENTGILSDRARLHQATGADFGDTLPLHSNLYIKQIEFDVHIAALQKQHWIGGYGDQIVKPNFKSEE